ncbi:MAG: nitrate reductase [Gammaproteobacteria bacterium]|nr:MAG: nitrate reductase [Gammaproteobacteria bacterium]
MLSTVFITLFYIATIILVAGLAFRIWTYSKTPTPFKVPVTPAPVTKGGVVQRMAKEVIFFASLFKSNKWIWLFGWIFHMAMALVILRHLRYFTEPVWWWVALIQPFGIYAGFAMLFGLAALWGRRLIVERIRYISAPSDHLMLILLMAITGSGLAMKYVAHTDIVALKEFMLGIIYFDWQTMPSDPILMVHLGLVISLMIIFPFSKLLHAPGMFFSPSRNQVDDAREKRHLAPWAEVYESKKPKAGVK